jgi:biotin synthase
MTERQQWMREDVQALFDLPFNDLMFKAQTVHRENFDPNEVQISTLLSIKTGACPEDCKYCPQSGHYNTDLEKEKLMQVQAVIEQAREAKATGASRFCMGAAWRSPTKKDMPMVLDARSEIAWYGNVYDIGNARCFASPRVGSRWSRLLQPQP